VNTILYSRLVRLDKGIEHSSTDYEADALIIRSRVDLSVDMSRLLFANRLLLR